MSSSSPDFDIDVALRTIEEQQHIIRSLHELAQTLKQQVQELELTDSRRASNAPRRSSAETDQLRRTNHTLQEENRQLREALARTEDAKDTVQSRCATLTDAVTSAGRDKEALEAQLGDLEFQLERERKMHQFTDGTCSRLTGTTAVLQAEAHRVGLEKTRWKALATALAHRMEPAVQARVLLHIRAMEEEEGRQRADGVPSAGAPPAVVENTSPVVQGMWRKSVDLASPADKGARSYAGAPTSGGGTCPAPAKKASGRSSGPLPPL